MTRRLMRRSGTRIELVFVLFLFSLATIAFALLAR